MTAARKTDTKDNTLIALNEKGRIQMWTIDAPHPEGSIRTLFGKVWYEGYNKPEYVWQSSSQSDDTEPKLSLIPLIFGTMKGTPLRHALLHPGGHLQGSLQQPVHLLPLSQG